MMRARNHLHYLDRSSTAQDAASQENTDLGEGAGSDRGSITKAVHSEGTTSRTTLEPLREVVPQSAVFRRSGARCQVALRVTKAATE
jgi:hypothetical protein